MERDLFEDFYNKISIFVDLLTVEHQQCTLRRCRNVSRIVWSFLIIPHSGMTRHHPPAGIPTVQWSPAPLAAVTPNPVTNCHETFALQESLNRWCQDKFIQTVGTNIIITDYHNSQSVITEHTRPNTPLSVSLRVSGSWTNHSQVSLSPPIRALGGTRGVPGWSCPRHLDTVTLVILSS